MCKFTLKFNLVNNPLKDNWDKIYSEKEDTELSWYEEFPAPAVEMLNKCSLQKDDIIFIAGAGTSTILNYMIDNDFSNIIANDISQLALDKLKQNLGIAAENRVKFIADDLTNPTALNKLSNIALWYDRAVLHFFTKESERQNYFSLLKKILKPGGFVIIAEFSPDGPKKCNSLDTYNYDQNSIQQYLGADFTLIEFFNYTYHSPTGDPKAYIYTLFQKNA